MNRSYSRSGFFAFVAALALASFSAADTSASTTLSVREGSQFVGGSMRTESARDLDAPRGTERTVATSYQRLYPGTEGSKRWDRERQQLEDRAKARCEPAVSADGLLDALAAKARTPADHLELQGYFERLERQYTADATAHTSMAGAYIGTRIAWAATHCEQMASQARELASGAKAAAAEQGRLAAASR